MTDKPILRGLDSPEHLRAWMKAAGREFLVLRVADILDMGIEDQRLALDIMAMACRGDAIQGLSSQEIRGHIQGAGINGYVLIPRDNLCKLSLDDLGVVQQWIYVYREIRLGKGEPNRTNPCSACGGRGSLAGKDCEECDGDGRITTFLEISEEEIALSEGKK